MDLRILGSPRESAANSNSFPIKTFGVDGSDGPELVTGDVTKLLQHTDRLASTKREAARPDVIIGFDAEWVNGARADDSMPSDVNILLSYQMVVLNPLYGRTVRLHHISGESD